MRADLFTELSKWRREKIVKKLLSDCAGYLT